MHAQCLESIARTYTWQSGEVISLDALKRIAHHFIKRQFLREDISWMERGDLKREGGEKNIGRKNPCLWIVVESGSKMLTIR
jgi:hypothetical protein